MQPLKYLRDVSYYEALYDKQTVEECRWTESYFSSQNRDKPLLDIIATLLVHEKSGERYLRRKETIERWMERDRLRDQKFENAIEPQNIVCKFCKEPMELMDKYLDIGIGDKPDLVQFLFRCKECRCGKQIFDNGKVIDLIPWKCPICSKEMKTIESREGDKIFIKKECSCGHKEESVLELSKPKNLENELTKDEQIQFEKDKDRFCLSDKAGEEYRISKANINALSNVLGKSSANQPYKNPPLKEITFPQLLGTLKKPLAEANFKKLTFGEPKIGKDIEVDFKVYDTTDRGEYDSRIKLKKLITSLLKDTNWKLMGEGIRYRLGILTGRLKTLPREHEFMIDAKGNKILY